jgi:hypothetical protein
MGAFYDITGQKFGRLTVIKRIPSISTRTTRWLCKCDCGSLHAVNKNNLINGQVKSCGCLASELKKKRKTRTTHGMSYTRLYYIWQGIKRRCYYEKEPSYPYYGAIGITVCDEWRTFENFKEWALNNGYSDDLTIDRVDNSVGYSPENCRWTTIKEQNRNKTTTRHLTFNGHTKCLSAWCDELGLPKSTVVNRLNRGWPVEEALSDNYTRRNGANETQRLL